MNSMSETSNGSRMSESLRCGTIPLNGLSPLCRPSSIARFVAALTPASFRRMVAVRSPCDCQCSINFRPSSRVAFLRTGDVGVAQIGFQDRVVAALEHKFRTLERFGKLVAFDPVECLVI